MKKETDSNVKEEVQSSDDKTKLNETFSLSTKDTIKMTDLKKGSKLVKEKVMYVGPTITGVVIQNTIFSNGIPDTLQAVINDMPSIGNLLVPISKLPDALTQINSKQGAMHIFNENAKQYKPKKGV